MIVKLIFDSIMDVINNIKYRNEEMLLREKKAEEVLKNEYFKEEVSKLTLKEQKDYFLRLVKEYNTLSDFTQQNIARSNILYIFESFDYKLRESLLNGLERQENEDNYQIQSDLLLGIYDDNLMAQRRMYNYNFQNLLRSINQLEELIRNRDLRKINLLDLDGYQFEDYCAKLLSKHGFVNIKVSKGSGDKGVDITAIKNETLHAFQCKLYSGSVPRAAIEQIYTGMQLYKADYGYIMTNSDLTPGAKVDAETLNIKVWRVS